MYFTGTTVCGHVSNGPPYIDLHLEFNHIWTLFSLKNTHLGGDNVYDKYLG